MQRHNIPGTVAISFGPAEEQLASRPFLVREGYFKDVDAIIYLHIGDQLSTGFGLQNYAAISSLFTFHGKTAHGSTNPWDGRDAVDAVVLMDIGVDKLREHLRPTARAHRTITIGGIQPNIIADKGQIWWFVRDASMPAAKANYDRVVKIAEGAALMTGTTMEVKYAASAWPQLGMRSIAEAIQKNIDAVGMPKWSEADQRFAREFQKSQQQPEVGLRTRGRAARRAPPGERVERQWRRVVGRAGGHAALSVLGSGHRVPRMAGRGDAGERDLPQGPGGGRRRPWPHRSSTC